MATWTWPWPWPYASSSFLFQSPNNYMADKDDALLYTFCQGALGPLTGCILVCQGHQHKHCLLGALCLEDLRWQVGAGQLWDSPRHFYGDIHQAGSHPCLTGQKSSSHHEEVDCRCHLEAYNPSSLWCVTGQFCMGTSTMRGAMLEGSMAMCSCWHYASIMGGQWWGKDRCWSCRGFLS